eukprot:m.129778 g.129778  ORF g.129778 m.129778 type:complete len:258 (-) comp29426_c0_seq2:663-1436(-)
MTFRTCKTKTKKVPHKFKQRSKRLSNNNKVIKTPKKVKATKNTTSKQKSQRTKPSSKEVNLEWCSAQLPQLFEHCPDGGLLKLMDASELFEGPLSKNLSGVFQDKDYIVESCNYCNQCNKLATACASKSKHKRNRLQIVKNIRVREIPTRNPLSIGVRSTKMVKHEIKEQMQIKKEHVRINKERPQVKHTHMQIKEELLRIKNEPNTDCTQPSEPIGALPCIKTDLPYMYAYENSSFDLPYFSLLHGLDLSEDFCIM